MSHNGDHQGAEARQGDDQRGAGTRWFDQVPPIETATLAPPGPDPSPSGPGVGAGNNGGDGTAAGGVATRRDEQVSWSVSAGPAKPPRDPGLDRLIRTFVDVAVVAICVGFVFLQMGPSNVFSSTTPAGGDMGAHVWGPAYLRDVLLPNLQVTGWSPDWYAGFPAYQFYMVVPSLLIVVLDLGFEGPFMVFPLTVAGVAVLLAFQHWGVPRRRWWLLGLAAVALLCVGLPYGVAFKLVAISGVVSMPLSAYLFGRLAGLRFPGPAAMAIASLLFLFYRGFTIYGGNIPSTLAGEFAFSMSLSLGLVYLGVLFRGLETGRHRALAAGLLALTGLCHLIPAFWVLGATGIVVLLRWRQSNAPVLACAATAVAGIWVGLLGALLLVMGWVSGLAAMLLALSLVLLVAALWLANQSARWLTPVLVVGGMLSAFWVLPFYLRRNYLNDMGWEKLPNPDPETGAVGFGKWLELLFPSDTAETDLRWAFALAAVGLGVSIALRVRAGIFLGLVAVATGMAFWLLPQGRLWNARVLPFYYLAVILLACLAVVEVVRLVAELIEPRREPSVSLGLGAVAALLVVALIYVGLPLGVLPLTEDLGPDDTPGYAWPEGSPVQLESATESFVGDWANWNFTGYEEKPSYREYHEIVTTMGRLGDERGCGMALWEYQSELNRYGTPMALMLLPYWTDGCIGSMEGLYFEASATTPYHFMMQTELSAAPSSAQRDMPYAGFDITRGVQHLQLMGVRYYMATSPQAIQAAGTQPDLTQIASSGPWVVYEVAESDLVTGLINEPAVLDDIEPIQEDWLEEPRDQTGRFFGPSLQWFLDSQRWPVLLADDGPAEWQRIGMSDAVLDQPDERPIPLAEVSNIDADSDPQRISFDVDRPGSPVLVKASYFPNWEVDGGVGPWRVAPNLMVVVPTENHVELHFENTSVEWLAYALTAVGLVGLVLLARRGPYRFRSVGRAPTARAPAAAAEPVGAAPPDAGPFSDWLRAGPGPAESEQRRGEPPARPPVPPLE